MCVTRHAQSTQNKKFAYLCNISRKEWESFLQADSITLSVHSQACLKYPKQQVYNIFAISQGKREWWSCFLAADKRQSFLQSDAIILGVCGQACPKLPKIASFLFLCNILRKKWVMKLIFCMQIGKLPTNW